MKRTIQFKRTLGAYKAEVLGQQLYLCSDVMQKYFDFPLVAPKIWVTISDTPLPQGYKVYQKGATASYDVRTLLFTPSGNWYKVAMVYGNDDYLRSIGLENRFFYVNVQYECEGEES